MENQRACIRLTKYNMTKHKILEEVQRGHIVPFAFPLLYYLAFLICKVKKPIDNTKESYSLPQKTLLLHCLKHLVWSRAFTSLTYVCHYVRGEYIPLYT